MQVQAASGACREIDPALKGKEMSPPRKLPEESSPDDT